MTTNEWIYRVHRKTLSNRLRILIIERPHLFNAAISVLIKTGSRYESIGNNGISHFLEHMLFRGTTRYPTAGDLNFAFERMGASFNGATSPDLTEYVVSAPRETVCDALRLTSEMILSPLFSDIEIEKKIVAEEILEDFDERGKPINLDNLTRERLWKNHPLGLPVAGSVVTVAGFQDADIRNWYSQMYTAPQTVICVAGSVSAEECLLLSETLFEQVPGDVVQIDHQPVPAVTGCDYKHVSRPGSQTQLRVSLRTPGSSDPLSVATEVMLRLMDDGMSTPVHQRIFEQQGLAYHVSSSLEHYPETGAIHMDATASHDNIQKIIRELSSIVQDIPDMAKCSPSLKKAQSRAVWDLRRLQDCPESLCMYMGEQALFERDVSLQNRIEQIIAIQPKDICAAAAAIFRNSPTIATTVGNQTLQQQTINQDLTLSFGKGSC